jgi:hypothetical protein
MTIDGSGVCGSQLKTTAGQKKLNKYEADRTRFERVSRARNAVNLLIAAGHHSRRPASLTGRIIKARQGITSGNGIGKDDYEQAKRINHALAPREQAAAAPPECQGFRCTWTSMTVVGPIKHIKWVHFLEGVDFGVESLAAVGLGVGIIATSFGLAPESFGASLVGVGAGLGVIVVGGGALGFASYESFKEAF